jgi:hypothetical protein
MTWLTLGKPFNAGGTNDPYVGEIHFPDNAGDNARDNGGGVHSGQRVSREYLSEKEKKEMNAIRIRLNAQSAIALLLAALIMTLAAAPALAWEPEGNGTTPVRHTVVVSRAASHSSSGGGMIRLASPAYPMLKLRPSLARAE